MTNEQYYELIRPYEDARKLIETRLEVLSHSLYPGRATSQAIHNIQSRIKGKKSIEEKLARKDHTPSPANARDFLRDIAGIRVICYFVEDIYSIVAKLKLQSDLVFIKERDYVHSPKPNGYRSYHLVIGAPVYCMDTMEYFPVEIQFRTLAMDFWASMEHRICYKKIPQNREQLAEDFLTCSRILEEIEARFEGYQDSNPEDSWENAPPSSHV